MPCEDDRQRGFGQSIREHGNNPVHTLEFMYDIRATMSEEEDKSPLNDVDNAEAGRPNNGEEDCGDGPSNVDCGGASSPQCQLDIGLGTHTDSRRHDNGSSANGENSNVVYAFKLFVRLIFKVVTNVNISQTSFRFEPSLRTVPACYSLVTLINILTLLTSRFDYKI